MTSFGGLQRTPEQLNRPLVGHLSVGRLPSVRQQLRQATAEVHEALHHHPGFVRLIEERMTRSEYQTLLARLYGFHWALERELREAPTELLNGFNVVKRERSSALRADLQYLGVSRTNIDALPVCEALGPVHSYADLMGRLYVVEGSALGGRLMASRLDSLLGHDSTEGRQFFFGRAAPDPLPWPAFCRLLEGGSLASDIDAVIESAVSTFGVLADWLTDRDAHV